MLANYGLGSTDLDIVTVTGPAAGIRALIEGRADAAPANVVMGGLFELEAARGARFLSFHTEPEAVARMQQHFPLQLVRITPEDEVPGVASPLFLASYDFYLVCNLDLPTHMAHEIVRVLSKFNDDLTNLGGPLKDWKRERFYQHRTTIPYHPAALDFLQE
jgi:TRAP-type uncharacterized transport system substrate-binding protein